MVRWLVGKVNNKESLRLKVALDATNTGVWEWDLQTDEVVWDERMERLFEYNAGEFPGTYQGFATRVHPDDLPRVEDAHERGIEEGFYEATFRVIGESGPVRWVKARAEVVYEDNESRTMIGIVSDITAEKETEVQLKIQNDQLEEFANIVSHDLRNPLSVAEGYLELELEATESENLRRIQQAHERMRALIEDILTLSRQGNVIDEMTEVDLAVASESCWQNVETKDATLTIDTESRILADESRLAQLLENVMRNAIEHGGSAVTVTIGDLPNEFSVEDTGVGIPEDDRKRIFETGYSTTGSGAGIGLRIVKRIATAHGWEIDVTSGTNGGVRFEITGVELP